MEHPTAAIRITELSHRYARRIAVSGLNLEIAPGQIFMFLGKNGSGKTTLFRVLSTLIPLQQGRVEILGFDLQSAVREVRCRLGVVFQSPSLDRKLTVAENIRHQGALYGISGNILRDREKRLLRQLGLTDRAGERVEKLSGGLRRRVELAKGMIHQPQMLLLDEPSTGLDPAARSDLLRYLQQLRDQFHVTVAMTTHLLEEADRADRIAILDEGKLVAVDSPDALRDTVGGDSVTIETQQPESLSKAIAEQFHVTPQIVDGRVRLELADGHHWISRLMETFADQITAIKLGKPTLEDVFIDKTGHRFFASSEENSDA